VERADVSVESLVPQALQQGGVDQFLENVASLDEAWATRVSGAAQEGKRLAYVGAITDGTLEVGVQAIPAESALGQLQGTDNVVIFETDRYHVTPLVVQGPGAGPRVTAAGILADVIQAAELVA